MPSAEAMGSPTRSPKKLAAAVAYGYGHVVVGSEGELEYGDWVSVADRLLPLPPVQPMKLV